MDDLQISPEVDELQNSPDPDVIDSVTEDPAVNTESGDPVITDSPEDTKALTLEVSDYNMVAVKSIPIGALSGAIFMIIGFAYLGIVHIFKKV